MQTLSCETYLAQKAKICKLIELSKIAQDKSVKINTMLDELRRWKNVQNRQPQTWLSEDEYAQVDIEWK